MSDKIKVALYWGATCGGCDVAVLDLNEKILQLVEVADIVFWPIALDFKYPDIESYADNSIDISLFNGSIMNSENKKIAELLRKKSKIMIAFGSCSCFGGIPGLSNISNNKEIFEVVYKDTPSTENPDFVTPKHKVANNGYELSLPERFDTTFALNQVVDVDYYIPGCAPNVELIEKGVGIIKQYAETGELPPKGAVFASNKSLCDECKLIKKNKIISKIKRPYEIIPDPERCLLEQGILCMGPATRGGCGNKCINALMPCRGCMGPLPNVIDQGAKMISAIASILGLENDSDFNKEILNELISEIKDPLGTFYRFTLPTSLINRNYKEKGQGGD